MATYGAHSPMVLLFALQNKDAIQELARLGYIGQYGSYEYAKRKQVLVEAKQQFFSDCYFNGYHDLITRLVQQEEEKLHDKAARDQDVLGDG